MGQFSWLDCVTGERIINNKRKNVYVLVPKGFGGGHIREGIYDGYGHFGGHDIFELVAEWNKEYISCENILHSPHYMGKGKQNVEWMLNYGIKDIERSFQLLLKFLNNAPITQDEKRSIGIDIACYDEQNASLKYPIKITYDKDAVYEDCKPSDSDPDQGWKC